MASHVRWASPECLEEFCEYYILRQWVGLSCFQPRAHTATNFKPLMKPIAHWLRLDPSYSKYIHWRANSSDCMHNLMHSWMPVAQAVLYHPPPRMIDLPMFLIQGLHRHRNWLICCNLFSKCWLERVFWLPLTHCTLEDSEVACQQIPNCRLHYQGDCQVSSWDRHRYPHCW